MTGSKIYLQPRGTILNAVSDLAELQKGKFTFSDTPNGKIHFLVKLYHNRWEFRFCVKDIGKNRSCVELEMDGDGRKTECMMHREYALLDSLLIGYAQIEMSENDTNGKTAVIANF